MITGLITRATKCSVSSYFTNSIPLVQPACHTLCTVQGRAIAPPYTITSIGMNSSPDLETISPSHHYDYRASLPVPHIWIQPHSKENTATAADASWSSSAALPPQPLFHSKQFQAPHSPLPPIQRFPSLLSLLHDPIVITVMDMSLVYKSHYVNPPIHLHCGESKCQYRFLPRRHYSQPPYYCIDHTRIKCHHNGCSRAKMNRLSQCKFHHLRAMRYNKT